VLKHWLRTKHLAGQLNQAALITTIHHQAKTSTEHGVMHAKHSCHVVVKHNGIYPALSKIL
jgi:hypothetical protein